MEGNPEPTALPPEAVPILPDEIANRRRRPQTRRSSPEAESNSAPPRSRQSVPDVEADTDLANPLRVSKHSRPRLKPAPPKLFSRHRANAAPRRLTPFVKLPPNPKSIRGPPVHVVNFALPPLIAEPAVPRTTAPRRLLRRGKVNRTRDGAENGNSAPSVACAHFFSPAHEIRINFAQDP